MSGCRHRQDLTFQYPCSFRFPLRAGGTEPMRGSPREAGGTKPLRFPSRSRGNQPLRGSPRGAGGANPCAGPLAEQGEPSPFGSPREAGEPILARVPSRSRGNQPLRGSPREAGGTKPLRFPSRSGGNQPLRGSPREAGGTCRRGVIVNSGCAGGMMAKSASASPQLPFHSVPYNFSRHHARYCSSRWRRRSGGPLRDKP
jgi:hypothetical protein